MNHTAINSSIWTTNSQSLSVFKILKFAAQFLIFWTLTLNNAKLRIVIAYIRDNNIAARDFPTDLVYEDIIN